MNALKAVGLTGFRNHAKTSIELQQINIFVGPSGAGKSSIKEAIEYALTGACSYTDDAGRGADTLIQDGAKAAAVTVAIDGVGMVARTIPNGLQVVGQDGQPWTGTLTAQQTALDQALGVDAKVIRACLNTTRFLGMKPDDQKDMLFRLAGLDFDQEKIENALHLWCTEQRQSAFDPFVTLREIYPAGLTGGPEILDKIYKAVYEERAIAKKTLKTREALVNAPLPASGLPAGATREVLAGQLAELRKQKEALLVEQGAAAGQIRARETLERELIRLHQELAGLGVPEGQYDTARVADLEKLLKEAHARARDGLDVARTRRGLAAGCDKQIAELMGKISAFASAGTCPVAAIPCGAKTAVLPALEEQVKKLEAARDEDLSVASKAEGDAEAAEAAAAEIDAHLRETERARKSSGIKNSIQDIEAQLSALPAPADTSSLNEEIAALATRIGNGEKMLAAAETEQRAKAERKSLEEGYAEAKVRVEALELLVEAFGPKGIKAQLLQNLIGPVEEGAKRRIAQLTGSRWDIAFNFEDGFDILVKTGPDGQFRTVKSLSKGERLRVGVILQLALNELTGLGILVVDDAEALGPQDRGLLVATLLAFRKEFGTAIVLAVKGDIPPHDPGIPGLTVFEVSDGTVQRIGAEVAKSA